MTGTLTETDRARLARGGGVLLGTEQALGLLDRALSIGRPVVAAGLDVTAVRGVIAAGTPVSTVLLGLGRAPRRAIAAAAGSTSALARRLGGLGEAERSLVLLELVREHAAVVLGHGDGEGAGVPADRAFRDLGFDSLTAVELRNRLAAASGLTLPATLVFDYPTPRVLAEYLVAQVTGAAPAAVKAAPAPVPVLGGLDEVEAALAGLGADDAALRDEVRNRLKALLWRLDDHDKPDETSMADHIMSASIDQVIQLVAEEFGDEAGSSEVE
ncbi:hypothetical protein M271_40490 [Streptomyces rapamycinicus NRRL 5491]|nr:acyl carrier protein [Streptomyces rapamycinicus]AGP59477.1 hypothetical protein M271_40490 [Streptomyces rapamycinicus NRRL 5491]